MPAQVPLVCLSAAANASDRRLAASTAAKITGDRAAGSQHPGHDEDDRVHESECHPLRVRAADGLVLPFH